MFNYYATDQFVKVCSPRFLLTILAFKITQGAKYMKYTIAIMVQLNFLLFH